MTSGGESPQPGHGAQLEGRPVDNKIQFNSIPWFKITVCPCPVKNFYFLSSFFSVGVFLCWICTNRKRLLALPRSATTEVEHYVGFLIVLWLPPASVSWAIFYTVSSFSTLLTVGCVMWNRT